MIKLKNLTLATMAATTFIFSGCVHMPDALPYQDTRSTHANIKLSLLSYDYPYYYDRPYYFLRGRYYYGGYYDSGYYHFGNQIFRQGHYYRKGHRYYKGRRYQAINGRHGYHVKRRDTKHSSLYNKRENLARDRGRTYNRQKTYRNMDTHNTRTNRHNVLNKQVHRMTRQRPIR